MAFVGFTIKPVFQAGPARKEAQGLAKDVREQDKLLKAVNKSFDAVAKNMPRGLRDIEHAAAQTGKALKGAFHTGLDGLEKFNKGIDGVKKKLFSLKAVVAESLIGIAAYEGTKKIFEAGRADMSAIGRIRREFGAEAGDVERRAEELARRTGMSRAAAMRAIVPVAEAVGTTQEGTLFRGRRLNAAQAASVRSQTLGVGTGLLERILTVAPELDPGQVALALSTAGTGPEGMRALAGELGLNRTFAHKLIGANEKGQLARLFPQIAQKQGIKAGEVAGQGTLIDILLGQAGITEEAATAKRSKFEFQMKSMGATLENALGEVGTRAMQKLNDALGKGGNLAEKLEKYLASEKGKKLLDDIAGAVAKMVDGVGYIAKKIPEIISFVSSHSGALLAVAGTYGGLRLAGGIRGVLGNSGVSGLAGKALGMVSDAEAIPVRVVNLPGGGLDRTGPLGGPTGGAGSSLASRALGLLTPEAGIAAGGLLSVYEAGHILTHPQYIKGAFGDRATAGSFDRQRQGQAQRVIELIEQSSGPEDAMRRLNRAGFQHAFGGGQLEAVARAAGEGTIPSNIEPALKEALANEFKANGISVTLNINASVAHDVPGFVDAIMPHIERQMKDGMSRATAGGAARASRAQ